MCHKHHPTSGFATFFFPLKAAGGILNVFSGAFSYQSIRGVESYGVERGSNSAAAMLHITGKY